MNKKIKQSIFIFFGLCALVVAYIGIIMPGLPSMPFILLAGWFFLKGSERLYNWMSKQRFIGKVLKKYFENDKISNGSIALVIIPLWMSVGIAQFVFSLSIKFLFINIGIVILLSFLIYYILKHKGK